MGRRGPAACGRRFGFWTVLTGLIVLTVDVNSVHSVGCQHSQSSQRRQPSQNNNRRLAGCFPNTIALWMWIILSSR